MSDLDAAYVARTAQRILDAFWHRDDQMLLAHAHELLNRSKQHLRKGAEPVEVVGVYDGKGGYCVMEPTD